MYIINVKLYFHHGRSLLHIAEMMGKKVTLRLFERFIIIIDDYLTKLLNSLLLRLNLHVVNTDSGR